MLTTTGSFSGFSVLSIKDSQAFYGGTLGFAVEDNGMGLKISLPGGTAFAYAKADHQPATFTILNFEVADIDKAVEELTAADVTFEIYEGMHQDEKGIARGRTAGMGPDIAWFKDPSGNILSVLH